MIMPRPASADQHLLDVLQRMGVVVLQIIKGRAPVPALDIVGAQFYHRIEQFQRDIDLLSLHRRLGARHQQRRGVAGRLQPLRPDPRLDMLGAGFVRRRLQRAEQEVQAAGAVGPNLRQLARGFRQFLLLLGRGNDSGIILRERRRPADYGSHHHGGHHRRPQLSEAEEFRSHDPKSRRTKSRCKAARRQRPVSERIFW
jgi:hypothetical protein